MALMPASQFWPKLGRWLYLVGPLVALLLLDSGAFVYLHRQQPLPVTAFSLAIAVLIALVGLVPALVRPDFANTLAGCLMVLLAAILLVPLDGQADTFRPLALSVPFWQAPDGFPVRLANMALLGPVALHLTTIFPLRRRVWAIPLLICYAISLLLLRFGLSAQQPLGRRLVLVLSFWTLLLLSLALIQLGRACIDMRPEHQRSAQQARLLLVSVLLAEAPVIIRPLRLFLGQTLGPFAMFLLPYELILGMQVLLPLGMAYAVVRHDLFGIDSALRRTLAYGTLTLMVLVVYFGLTLLLTAIFTAVLPQFTWLATIVALLAAAALFEPLRGRAQRLVDRLLYPARRHFQHEIASASAVLSNVAARADVVALLTQQLPQRIDAAWATLDLVVAPGAPALPAAPADAGFRVDLVVGGEVIGRYALGHRRGGPTYGADELAQLRALAQQAALALAYAKVYDQLRELNADLEHRVALRSTLLLEQARELAVLAERQRLARELHDSVTQALFSISLSARALPRLLRRDPVSAQQALEDQERTAQQALAEMRDLLAQLRDPAALHQQPPETDVAAALREHCAHVRRQYGLAVVCELPPAAPLPSAQAAALLRVAQEALHNTYKHSGAAQARLSLLLEPGQVSLDIADAGRGFDLAALGQRGGFGVQGMRERVAELGGVLLLDSRPGQGTAVHVRVPLGPRG